MKEIWKPIKDYEDLYEVSNTGKVRRGEHELNRYSNNRGKGYLCVALCKNGIRKRCTVHKLVAQAFLPEIKGKNQINHIDGNPSNNNLYNLERVSNRENTTHAYNTGLNSKVFKICVENIETGICVIYPTMRQASIALGYCPGWLYYAFKTKGEIIKLKSVKIYKCEGVRSNVS